jgi:hypothetical protein
MNHQTASVSAPAYSAFPLPPPKDLLNKPMVIPRKPSILFLNHSLIPNHTEQPNIFHIKSLSPLAPVYSLSVQTLADPISATDFLSFMDGLNVTFLSSPIFQAAHVIGGGLLGNQILTTQAVGGVLQVVSVLGSAGVLIARVREYMKTADKEMFTLRGLAVKVLSRKKMMGAIKFDNVDGKGKLALPPLDILEELTPASRNTLTAHDGSDFVAERKLEVEVEDPWMRRPKALLGLIAPLEFETDAAPIRGALDKYCRAPLS